MAQLVRVGAEEENPSKTTDVTVGLLSIYIDSGPVVSISSVHETQRDVGHVGDGVLETRGCKHDDGEVHGHLCVRGLSYRLLFGICFCSNYSMGI